MRAQSTAPKADVLVGQAEHAARRKKYNNDAYRPKQEAISNLCLCDEFKFPWLDFSSVPINSSSFRTIRSMSVVAPWSFHTKTQHSHVDPAPAVCPRRERLSSQDDPPRRKLGAAVRRGPSRTHFSNHGGASRASDAFVPYREDDPCLSHNRSSTASRMQLSICRGQHLSSFSKTHFLGLKVARRNHLIFYLHFPSEFSLTLHVSWPRDPRLAFWSEQGSLAAFSFTRPGAFGSIELTEICERECARLKSARSRVVTVPLVLCFSA
ncbi:hypothetical protein BJ742DRAFT_784587 [Cladochytrium replicatum]|nr:hypothetical protein BJ742DRAFT_784587 [Cladochytrium replicatum]